MTAGIAEQEVFGAREVVHEATRAGIGFLFFFWSICDSRLGRLCALSRSCEEGSQGVATWSELRALISFLLLVHLLQEEQCKD